MKFKWANPAEEEEQRTRRPDGVVWNSVDNVILFLEFTRAMDNPDNMSAALERKGGQYNIAVEAARRANLLYTVATAPLIFGVRGTVLLDEARDALIALGLPDGKLKKALAAGVRAAITAASDMCSARAAALRCLPKAPRGADGKRIRVVIPPKPFKPAPWRAERGVW